MSEPMVSLFPGVVVPMPILALSLMNSAGVPVDIPGPAPVLNDKPNICVPAGSDRTIALPVALLLASRNILGEPV